MKQYDFTKDEEVIENLFSYKGNINLFNKLKASFKNNTDIENLNLKEGISPDKILSSFTLKILNEVILDSIMVVILFDKYPMKCINWIKVTLSNYELELSKFLFSLILEGLNDNNRLDNPNDSQKWIIKELSECNPKQFYKEPTINFTLFKYFTNDDSINKKLLIPAFLASRGLVKPENVIIEDFINRYGSHKITEFLSADMNNSDVLRKERSEELISKLTEYKFYKLDKVKALPNYKKISDLLKENINNVPYIMAMFEHLDFFKYLLREFFISKPKMFAEIAKWLNSNNREIQGNYYRLQPNTKEIARYKSDQYKQKAENDYQQLIYDMPL